MLNVAILGANGFIGSRAVELWHLGGVAEVRPVVRTLASMARLSRFDLDSRVADGFDEAALYQAFQGCDVVVHAIAGDRHTILGTLEPVYKAAQKAGVRRLVYLSSASVHGQAPKPGTDETSPLSDRQPIGYNNTKVQAERKLRHLRDHGLVELVILRPGIVFGPRSYWLTSFANALQEGNAYLVSRGQGICNSIYVDNLVHSIERAMIVTTADKEVFIVGDTEKVTWANLYAPIAEILGFDLDQIPEATPALLQSNRKEANLEEQIEAVLASKPSLALLSIFPNKWRRSARAALSTLLHTPQNTNAWQLPVEQSVSIAPTASLEMTLLQQCKYKLPHKKACQVLDYDPPISFQEACQRSIDWLIFAGYSTAYTQPTDSYYSLPISYNRQFLQTNMI